jgi:hypothetical protein
MKYIIIDFPVLSMDDTRIITVTLKVAEIILDSKYKFNYLITIHHPLFFNVLFHKKILKRIKKLNSESNKIGF